MERAAANAISDHRGGGASDHRRVARQQRDVPLEAPVAPPTPVERPSVTGLANGNRTRLRSAGPPPPTTPEPPWDLLQNVRTLAVNASRARFFGNDQMKAALYGNKDFAALQLVIVDDPGVADVILDVGYTFAWEYPFSLTHRRTSIVLVSGKGVGPLSPSAGAGSVARELAKLLKPYRPSAP